MPVSRRWPLAVLAALLAAEAGVLLLRPRSGVIEPVPIRAGDYFTPAQIERGRDYERPQPYLALGALAVELAVLGLLVRRPPAVLTRPRRRPLAAGAATGAALSLGLAVAGLPFGAVSHVRARNVGLATQGWPGWAGDQAKSLGLGAGLAAGGGALAVALLRRFPRGWWIPGTGAVIAIGAAFIYAGPVVLDPVFNTFTPLPPGPARTDVLDLARRAGVRVGQVYEIDASRRTTAVNAYVTGLGASKRVVIYDTLLNRFSPAQRRLVVAHELGHVHYDDVPHGLLYLALVAPFGLFAVAAVTRRLAPGAPGAATLPALALALGLVATPMTWISNGLSRRIEARADSFALRMTHEPEAFIAFEQHVVVANVSDPDPPAWVQWVFGTHPTDVQRIGTGVAADRRLRAGAPKPG
jgi:Zn-dependent protease with chaperone function